MLNSCPDSNMGFADCLVAAKHVFSCIYDGWIGTYYMVVNTYMEMLRYPFAEGTAASCIVLGH